MKKKTLLFSLLAMFALVCAGGWYLLHQNQAQTVKAEARKTYIQSSRPTIFFHGWGSSSRVERHMANAAKKAGVTQTIIEAKVAEDGTVTLKGTIPKDAVNPIVLVNFDIIEELALRIRATMPTLLSRLSKILMELRR